MDNATNVAPAAEPILDQIEEAIGKAAEAEPTPAPAPALPAAGRKVWIKYAFQKGNLRDTTVIYLTGVADLRTEADIRQVELLIKDNQQVDMVRVEAWRALEG